MPTELVESRKETIFFKYWSHFFFFLVGVEGKGGVVWLVGWFGVGFS